MADKYDQARTGPERRTEPLTDLGEAGTSTVTQLEVRINELTEVLRKAGFLKS